MEEQWKPLSIDPRYLISTKGNIISMVHKQPRQLKLIIDSRGYYYVRIRNKGYNVHRLVALTFIPTDNTSLHIDHIDGDRLNNDVNNLRWCTQMENNNNPITRARISKSNTGSKRTPEQRERMSIAQKKAKTMLGKHHSKETLEKFKHRRNGMKGKLGKDNPNSRPVAMIDRDGNTIEVFDSSLIVNQLYGIARESICRCCNGKQKSAGGYMWKYIEKEIEL